MSRYADGDDGAFRIVYEVIAPSLELYLRGRVRDKAAVEDVLQSTFLQMHRARAVFIRGAPVLPWALVIAMRLSRDMRKRGAREVPSVLDGESGAPFLMAPAGTVEEEAIAAEVSEALRGALSGLSERQRLAFDLVNNQGLSHTDAARILCTTVTSIKMLVHRCYLALRAALKRGDNDPERRPGPAKESS